MLAQSTVAELRGSAHDPPRILVSVEDGEQRAALASALRDTGYEVAEVADPGCAGDADPADFDLVLADRDPGAPGAVPTMLLPDAFDVVEVEMLVLDVLGWDGPPTLRRVPVWAVTS
jgi:CheY-like chemotaxis protein